jgi:hypothetical protein
MLQSPQLDALLMRFANITGSFAHDNESDNETHKNKQVHKLVHITKGDSVDDSYSNSDYDDCGSKAGVQNDWYDYLTVNSLRLVSSHLISSQLTLTSNNPRRCDVSACQTQYIVIHSIRRLLHTSTSLGIGSCLVFKGPRNIFFISCRILVLLILRH